MSSDVELLEAWRAGDRGAGNALVRKHFGRIHRFFRSKVDEGIEDLAQQTFLAAVEARDRVENDAAFAAYVFGIARRQLMMALRKKYARAKVFAPDEVSLAHLGAGEGPGVQTWLGAREEQAILVQALRSIPLDYQIAIELHYWEGLTVQEIASVVEAPAGTVKSRLSRARKLLEAQLQTRLSDEAATQGLDALVSRVGESLGA